MVIIFFYRRYYKSILKSHCLLRGHFRKILNVFKLISFMSIFVRNFLGRSEIELILWPKRWEKHCQIKNISSIKMVLGTLQFPFGFQQELYVRARRATERQSREFFWKPKHSFCVFGYIFTLFVKNQNSLIEFFVRTFPFFAKTQYSNIVLWGEISRRVKITIFS